MMPVLFVGHGSPTNALGDSDFSRIWKRLGQTIPRPAAIVAISAHWLRRGTAVTAMSRPPTIHDFYGFPDELFALQYPAPGNPELARRLAGLTPSSLDNEWGLDHGTWSVLIHMFPDASIPVVQLSLDIDKTADEHFQLGRMLHPLREEGILILGSGNIVHNLALMDWRRKEGFAWAERVNDQIKAWIRSGDYASVLQCEKAGGDFKQAIPTPEHFWPLLYVLGASKPDEPLEFFTDAIPFGAVAMTGLKVG